MLVSIFNKTAVRIRKQGIMGLFCVALIKIGVFLQRSGFYLERKMFLSLDKASNKKHFGSYPGVLEVIQRSYESSNSHGLHASNSATVTWIIPPFSKGSGGHTTIFRFVSGLEKLGLKCKIYILNDMQVILDADLVKEEICKYFSPIEGDVEILLPENMARSEDILICTSWHTAYAARVMAANRKIYFMQDYEPYFSPIGSYYYFAEETYRMGFEYFTAGPWLLSIAENKYRGKGGFFYLCPDQSIYYPRTEFQLPELIKVKEEQRNRRLFTIGLYNRAQTPRRCVELVWVALSLLAERKHSFLVLTFGDDEHRALPFPNRELGILNHDQLAEVYSYCDIVIAPSATNLSLLAREVMACGSIVLDLLGENTDGQLHDMEDSILCRPEVNDMLDTLEKLIKNPEIGTQLKAKLIAKAPNLPTWEEQFVTMRDFLSDPEYEKSTLV